MLGAAALPARISSGVLPQKVKTPGAIVHQQLPPAVTALPAAPEGSTVTMRMGKKRCAP